MNDTHATMIAEAINEIPGPDIDAEAIERGLYAVAVSLDGIAASIYRLAEILARDDGR